jgi:hypothetical protein
MKGKHYDYIFLLVIIIIGLLGGFLMQSYKEAFSVKETYNSTKRKMRKHWEPFKEGMFAHYHYHNLFGRKSFF